MIVALLVVGILLALILHEAGHALVMWRNGIEIEEFGIGIPVPYIPRIRLKFGTATAIAIHPVLLGAYVKPSKEGAEDLEHLPARERAFISGAGILANIFLAAAIVPANLLLFGNLVDTRTFISFLLFSGFSVFICALLWFFRYPFCRYVIPVIGSCVFVILSFLLVRKFLFPEEIVPGQGGPQVVGPAGMAGLVMQLTKERVLFFVADISLSLALFNMIPLMPMDGGRIMMDAIEQKFGEKFALAYYKATTKVFILLIAIVLCGDLLRAVLR